MSADWLAHEDVSRDEDEESEDGNDTEHRPTDAATA